MLNLHQGGCWPTPSQENLLRAALLSGSEAISSWHQWRAQLDFDNIDHASERLIPLLYHNLKKLRVEDPLMGRFQGIYRQSWYRNQLLESQIKSLLADLQRQGIDTLIFKGGVLGPLYYKDSALRPMSDLDVLVPESQVEQTLHYAQSLGWEVDLSIFDNLTQDHLDLLHAVGMKNDSQCEFDLHWNSRYGAAENPELDWANAITTKLHGIQIHTLNPEAHLLLICAHGLRWNTLPPVRWVADCYKILEATPDFDWQLLLEIAKERRLILTLRHALSYAQKQFYMPIPDSVLSTLQTLSVSDQEELEYRVHTKPRGLLGPLPLMWCSHRRALFDQQPSRLKCWSLFCVYVWRYWKMRGGWRLVGIRLKQRMARKLPV